ncbi:MAG: hypothetical protein M0R03_14940 [Novosphingobium sp.]|nr:hypothetical protein [Novosphingobium sp.]
MACLNKIFKKHKWTKWKEIETGKITRNFGDVKLNVGVFSVIRRECEECGLVQLDRIKEVLDRNI